MRVYNKQLTTNQVLNVNSTSPASALKSIFMYAMAANFTGSATGSIKLQASNDPETNDTPPSGIPFPAPTNWADIANSTFAIVPGMTEVLWNVRDVAYNYVRVVYTDGSGGTSTATMNIVINGKGQ